MSYKSEPIAIIGSACRFPGGSDSTSKLWELLREPRDLSQKVPSSRFDVDTFYHPEATHHGTTNATKSYFLEEDIAHFDAGFFNIQPKESDAIDPQQRLLLETVYDSLCAAGLPVEKLRGSPTAVYVGMMCDDWSTVVSRDWETLPTYAATGLARSIVSNRISYFFDWNGPSMTIDTACSSSLVAVHQAVQTLRSGESTVAVATGTNLILSPIMYITETNLRMLSPSGRCAMWDASADGYARGEGVASVVLKTLSQALADGDPIECIIRETGVNQDGRTTGLTMPSNIAQAALVRETYRRAGLDINDPRDRPQFFHAHGTGTQAGDPQESEAISKALFPNGAVDGRKLYVGSIKTVIGHTEGTAGLAALIGTSLAMRHNTIPPNLHFSKLSPKVSPFYEHLEIPTVATPWPDPAPGGVKRASINSFGFGGTNAHAIIEAYEPEARSESIVKAGDAPLFTPLVFSAASDEALRKTLSTYVEYLSANPAVNIRDLAWTLQARRSTLPFRTAIACPTLDALSVKLDAQVNGPAKQDEDLSARYSNVANPKILAVFTGQGAQWPRMGARLIESSVFARERIAELDDALQSLPVHDRPDWTITDQLLTGRETSRIAEAVVSQPLCLAVQVILVDILRAAGIKFTAVVGHSSGEIGAAYAAGLLSAYDAVRIAYYRGLHARRAASPNGSKGAMMAVGTSYEDAVNFCQLEVFTGRIQVAAVNSASSITLSGDEDAIDEAIGIWKDEKKFARKLKVDTAYHSAHMQPCAEPYLKSMNSWTVAKYDSNGPIWFSSVMEGVRMSKDTLTENYWVDNMCNTVLFSSVMSNAISECGPFDLALEIGPHAALKGPATATIEQLGPAIPYTSCLSRDKNDIDELSSALGFIWTNLGSGNVNFDAAERLLSGMEGTRSVLPDLPAYPFDHQRAYWTGSRVSNHYKHRQAAPNPILGTLCSEAATSREVQWRNILRPNEISWLKGHKLQGQVVFPATGYVCMAVEAMKALAGQSEINLFKITDVHITRAIAFNDEGASVETLFSVSSVESMEEIITAEFACYSILPGDSAAFLNAKGRAVVHLAIAAPDTLPVSPPDSFNLVEVDGHHFYTDLSKIGYDYSPPFQGVMHIERNPDYSTGLIQDQSGSEWEDNLVVHPGVLDTALQTAFAAWSFPGDGRLWSLHVPTHISSFTFNPYFSPLGLGKQKTAKFESFICTEGQSSLSADIHLYTPDGSNSFVQIEGASLVPFSPASAVNDTPLFAHFQYEVAEPNGEIAAMGETMSEYEVQVYRDIDRIAYWYARNAALVFKSDERENLLLHFKYYLRWCDRMVEMVSQGEHAKVPPECGADTREDIARILKKYEGRDDIRFVEVVGDNLVKVIREGSSMLEYMNQGNLMLAFYENGLAAGPNNRWLGRLVGQIAHRYPHMNILEIGAGTGATTKSILPNIGSSFSSYTFTDISSGFFPTAEERFKQYSNRMIFKVFDMEKPSEQGFVEGQYDVVVAANVLHVSADMDHSMANVRRLLKPGGYLITLEVTSSELIASGMTVGTLPGWWLAAENGRPWGASLTLSEWDLVLQRNGFSGIDTTTPDLSSTVPITVFVTQAVDDRTMLLRNPLGFSPPETTMQSLAIVGGTTVPVYQLAEDISEIVSHKFTNVSIFETIEELTASEESITAGMTILNLSDLDQPFMKTLTTEKFNALKTLWNNAGALVWVTRNARGGEPYSYMMMGIGRTIKTEYPNINLQLVDIESLGDSTARTLSETLIRHQLLSSWEVDTARFLWSAEPEISMKDGHVLITRLVPDEQKNNRYNSQRRAILKDADPQTEILRLVGAGQSFAVHQASPLQQTAPPATDSRTIRITHSLLQSLRVGDSGFLRLCYGVDVSSAQFVLALSGSAESPAIVPSQWCVQLGDMAYTPSSLVSIAVNIIAEQIISVVPEFGILLVNEPDQALKSVLKSKAIEKNIKILFTTSQQQHADDNEWIYLHPNFSQRRIKERIPSSIVVFIHFSKGSASDAVQGLILNRLPPQCIRIQESSILSNELDVFPGAASDDMTALLNIACAASASQVTENELSHIPLADVSTHSAVGEPLAVVDWTAGSVSVNVQPIDSGIIFRPDRTYLFVGLAGELGQSLCRWMVARGARHFVLSSRTPNVNPKFIDAMAKQGATVRPMSLDITSRKSLREAYKVISSTMPAISGVINGAMILQDNLFDIMSCEQFVKVIKPKVEGTKLLDELFYDTPLDFFVVTSSITAIIGLSGQSNYSAANTFMTSLAYQRKERGVAGSAMVVPAVAGIGYAAQGNNFDFEYFTSIGYRTISEQDFCILFAEAVLSGRPGSPEKAEVVAGVNYVPADLSIKRTHRRDLKFTHYLLQQENGSRSGGASTTVRVKTQLESAKTKNQVYCIIQDSFVLSLKRILQIPQEDSIDLSVALVERGMDSLVAIEVRSWFLKEIDVDIPVLKVLGGSSVLDLLDTAIEKIPASVIDLDALEKGESGAPKSSSPPTPPEKSFIPRRAMTENSSLSTPLSTPVDSSSSETGPSSPDSRSPSPGSKTFLERRGPTEEELEKTRRDLIVSSSSETKAEMSFGQSRFWFLHHFLSDKTSFNFSLSARMDGPLRLQAFEEALNLVIQRHEALRTRFFWSEGDTGIPMQGVISTALLKLEKLQISSEAEAEKALQSLQNHVYELENWGAVRVQLLTLSNTVHYFLMGCHHIALDGQSTHIFMSELDKAYQGQALAALPASSQYRTFAAQQRHEHDSGSFKKEINFFRRNITKDPGAVELFTFSKVPSRRVMEHYKLNRAAVRLDPKIAMRVKQLARKLHCTNFHVYLSVLQALIFRLLPETNEFFVGIADSNRVDKNFIYTLGCLVNLLPIKFNRTESSKLSDAVKLTRNKVYGALEHSKVPFDVLLNELGTTRSGEYNPIFQIAMDYRQGDQENTTFAGVDTEVTFHGASTGYDLQLQIIDTAAGESLVVMQVQDYLYSQCHAELLLRNYINVLEQFSQSPTGDILLSSPTLWSQKDIDHAFEIGKGPATELLWPPTVAHRIDEMVKTYPTHIALKDGHGTILTYAQMSDRINTIATELVRAGVSEGTVVAVFQEPSADWTCSMLAIFRTGATYVPLDLKNGLERLLSSVQVAHPQVILADRWTMDKVSSLRAYNTDKVSSLRAYNTLTIDVSKVKTKTSYPDVPNISRADSTAVVLFTSGSTGVPKGIMLPHSCFVTHFEGFGRVWSDGPNVVLQQTTLSFDLSLYQIFTALVNGGTLCVVPSEKRGDPAEITKIMLTEGVTHSAATPTEYGMWFHLGSDNLSKCSAWSWALACGEALPKSVIRNFVGLGHSGLRLYNAYGPAEATFAITTGEIRYREIDLDQSVPTGYIFPNYSVYIMDENLKPVPVGVPGEIIAGGPGVASGYLGLDELTSEKFIKHPFLDKHAKAHGWDRLYRTGDRGHLSEDGLLYYEGRIDGDTQIKLRGIRIELGEVENAIMRAANGSITQAVVSAHGETDSKFLVAYVVFSPQQAVEDCDQLLANLRSALPIPQNMRPSFFIPMESLPMNTHGKTDRKALSSIPLSISASQGSAEQIMLTDTEKRLSQLWKSILPSQGVEFQADADFFHVGGNSLLFIKLQRLVKEAFCAAPRLIDLMSSSDLRSMARVIESAAANEVIDWELETAIPETWLSIRGQAKPLPKDNLTIVLTGATGYLGRHLLPRLVGDSRIYKIICLVRDKTKLTTTSNKISVFTCDLGEPNIGLSPFDFTRISEDADLIVHCAANRSFWDDYEVLRPVNFNAVKELTRMALPHCLPLHFFSSGAVSIYEGAAPPADGSDGYVTAKWASEKLLRNVAQQLSLPVCIHTPKAAPAGTPFTLDPAIIGDFVECAKRIGVRPNFEGFWGHLDLIETKQVLDKFCGTVLDDLSPTADDEVPSLMRVSYNGIARLDVNHAIATLNSDKAWSALPSMNVLLWMGEVKKNGFPYVLSSHHVTMSSGSKTVISRR